MSARPGLASDEGSVDPTPDEGPLDVAEEVARLADAVQVWWTSARGEVQRAAPDVANDDDQGGDDDHGDDDHGDGVGHAGHTGHEEGPGGHGVPSSSCRICPLCRALDLVRGVRPELLQQVATVAETIAVLLREAAAGDPRAWAAGRSAPTADDGTDDPDDDDPGAGDPGAGDPGGDVDDASRRGTRIVVTDASASPAGHEDEGGRGAWA